MFLNLIEMNYEWRIKRFLRYVFRLRYLMILLMLNAFADSTKTFPFGLLPLKMGNSVALSIFGL